MLRRYMQRWERKTQKEIKKKRTQQTGVSQWLTVAGRSRRRLVRGKVEPARISLVGRSVLLRVPCTQTVSFLLFLWMMERCWRSPRCYWLVVSACAPGRVSFSAELAEMVTTSWFPWSFRTFITLAAREKLEAITFFFLAWNWNVKSSLLLSIA